MAKLIDNSSSIYKNIEKVAVIGAGTMGAGIAGQVANAGVEVWLLDLPSSGDAVNALAERGFKRLKNADSPGLMSNEAGQLIHCGNTQDDFDQLADCDWIAEAVVERLDVKHALYKRIDAITGPDTIVTSNTSTIPISLLTQGMPQAFCERFAITHFFNPVRFMRLLELVRGEHTQDEVIDTLGQFCESNLGKGVVVCEDTPGFLGNRVGVFAIQCALHTAFDMGLSPNEADALFGRPMGIPKTGVFGLYDLIGIDLMADVAKSLESILPADDAFHQYAKPVPLMTQMIANGQTGNKGGQGFYRDLDGSKEVLDLVSGTYQSTTRIQLPLAQKAEAQGVAALLDDDSVYGRFAWKVLSSTLNYAAALIPEIGSNILPIDDAMKLGYNWIYGPFELIDQIGAKRIVQRMQEEGLDVAPMLLLSAQKKGFYTVIDKQLCSLDESAEYVAIERPAGVLRFSELRQTLTPQYSNAKASWFVHDNAAIVEFHSKANALDKDSMDVIQHALAQAQALKLRGVVLHNDAQHFSCGVNLTAFRGFFEEKDYAGMDHFLNHFQQTMHAINRCTLPVIAAPAGMSIGGGFEVVLAADHVIGHSNCVMGLVESSVGVVPGGGGCKEYLYRWYEVLGDIKAAAWKAFMIVGYGWTAKSPIEATEQAMLYPEDQYMMNRDRLLSEALSQLDQVKKAKPRMPLPMAGEETYREMMDWLFEAHDQQKITAHDVVVGTELARIFTGGKIKANTKMSEQDLFDAERESFLRLAQTSATQARIVSMLDQGAPIRN
ncbi:MAG: enoyl-CoA hydratase/isomerase family protein [Oceanospirillaceae bacterium]|nr:enoyl-CoA hydratase/isomerase family protein [Oceanospirillaceae bacterium]